MRGPGLQAVLVLVAVLGGLATGVGAGVPADTAASVGAGSPIADAGVDGTAFQTGAIDADGVLLRVEVQPDGDAVWTVEYRIQLDNRSEAFESLRRDVGANASRYRDQFGRRMARTAATASNATGREMGIRNVTVSARAQFVPEDYGFVTYRFEWTNFAETDGSRLRVGDALAGLFLDGQTTLVVGWPDGYEAAEVRPSPPDRTREAAVVWTGPTDFGSGEPRVVLTPESSGLGAGTLAAVAAVAAMAIVGVAWYRRGDPSEGGGDAAADGGTAGDVGTEPRATGTGPTPGTESTSGAGAGRAGDGASDAGPGAGEGTSGAATAAATATGEVGHATGGPDGDDRGDDGAQGEGDDGTGKHVRADDGDAAGDDRGDDGAQGEGDAADAADGDDSSADDSSADDRVPMELLSPEERVMRLVTDSGGRIKQQAVVAELDWSAARTSQVVGSLRESGQIETFRLGRENVLKLPDDDEDAP